MSNSDRAYSLDSHGQVRSACEDDNVEEIMLMAEKL